jgi:Cytochrome oxidase complex assembly protein 1
MSDFSEAPPRRSWFGRNWVWVLPVGCLLPVVLCCGAPFLVYFVGFTVSRSSEIYKDAMAKATSNDAIKQALGDPIQEKWLPTGKVNEAAGDAKFGLILGGPKATGVVVVEATKNAGKWDYKTFEVQVTNNDGTPGPHIDLLKDKEQNKADGPGAGDMKK